MQNLLGDIPAVVFETIGVVGFLVYVLAYSLLTFGKLLLPTTQQAEIFYLAARNSPCMTFNNIFTTKLST